MHHHHSHPSVITRLTIGLCGLILLLLIPASTTTAAPLFVPAPGVVTTPTQDVPVGSTFSFDVTFTNGADTGYGPYIDLIVPLAGADGPISLPLDGVTFNGANFLGSALTTYTVNITTPGCYDHPVARVPFSGSSIPATFCLTDPAQIPAQLIVIEMPVGSYTPGQPDLTATITGTLSPLADLSTPLTYYTRGFFRYGADPLDNPCCEPLYVSHGTGTNDDVTLWPSHDIIPVVAELNKTYVGPEGETATGPNFPKQYVITLEIADTETLQNVVITDTLPSDVVVTGVVVNSGGVLTSGVDYTLTPAIPPDLGPAAPADFTVTMLNPVSGANDLTVTYTFYTPEFDAAAAPILPPTTGDDDISNNSASYTAQWQPTDPRDPLTPFGDSVGPVGHTNKAIAIQKSVSPSTNPVLPLTLLSYSHAIQISDYFNFGSVTVTDIFSDGQRIVNDPFAPTTFDGSLGIQPRLTLTDGLGNTLTNFAFTPFFTTADLTTLGATPEAICANATVGAANLIISTFDIASDGVGVGTGDTEMIFCVSKLWAQQFPATNGVILGNATGGTQGTINYQTIVLEEFYDEYDLGGTLSGDASVDQGDMLDNAVTIRGILHERFSPFNPQAGNPIEEDQSGTTVTIGRGVFEKTIFAINGAPPVGTPPILQVGDVVTYRLRYELPATDIEDLTLTDYLPLPVFDVDGPIGPFSTTFNSVRPGDVGYAITYTPGTAQFGPSDTFSLVYDGNPTPPPVWTPVITTDSINNTVTFNYGDYDGNNSSPSVIDILLHVAVQDVVFADGLFLSNFLNVYEGSTNSGTSSNNTLVQVKMSRPVMSINKAIVAAEDTDPLNDPVFIPPVPATLGITAPGSSGVRFSARIYSPPPAAGASGATPADTPVNTIASDLIGAQAGNRVTFMLVIENTGSGINGAFDVVIRDSIPAGYLTPTSTAALNLTATLGDGTPLQIDGLGINNNALDLFTADGIQLINNSGNTNDPVCQHIDSGLGQNLIIVTYDLVLAPGVSPLDELQNTAQLVNYASQPGGTNLVQGDPLRDTATSTIHPPGIDKTVFATSEAHTTGANVVPGEIVTYQVQIAIPQGTSPNAVLTDDLPTSLIPIPASITITQDAAISYTPVTPTSSFAGQVLTINFGDIFNAALDTDTEFITVQYQARVANTVTHGNIVTNTAEYEWDYTTLAGPQRGSINDNASVTIVEPRVTIDKSVSPTSADAGDTVTYTITITADPTRPAAYDLDLTDLLTPHTEIVTGTLAYSSGVVGTIVSGNTAGDTLRITFDQLLPGQQSTYTFDALILNTVPPGNLINTATVTYTSKPEGNPGTTEPTEKGYTASDPATVNVSASLTKSIVATSEASSTNPDVLIGEIVRYRLVVQLPEGTSTNLQLRDNIPAGLIFLNDGTATVALVSNLTSQVTSTTLAGAGLNVAGTDPTLVTPTFVLPDDAVSSLTGSNNDTYAAGTDVFFKLGNVTNTNANNAQAEWIIVEFNALVANVGGNTNGTTHNNNFIFRVNGVDLQTSPNVGVTIRLPNIANFTKAVTSSGPYDAGNNVTYSITFSNTGTAPAYDVTVTDALPAELDLVNSTDVTFSTTGSGSFTNTSNATTDTVNVVLSVLEVGESVTITVTATLEDAAGALQTIANTANLAYSSLPGSNGTSPNPTGSTTPGAPGSPTGERTFPGTSGTNFTTTIPTVNKTLVPASPIQFAIGEDMTFNIVVTLPEGTLYNLRVEDAIPLAAPGFTTRHYDFVSGTIITTAAASGGVLTADFNGTFTTPNPVPSISGTDGNQQTWGFGDTVVPGDNDPSNNTFIVQVVMRYRNIAENQDTLPAQFNRGSIIWQSTSGGTDNTLNAFTGTEVREPVVTTAKLVSDTTPRYDDTVTYTINVTNNDAPTAPRPAIAYDVTVVDVINDAELTIVGGVCSANNGGTCVVIPNTPAPGQSTITATWDSIPVGSTYAFTFNATFPATVIPGNPITNSVTTTWTSTPGGNPNERDGSGGVNNYINTTNVILTPRGLALGNVLWFDDNNDGIFDATETSVGAGVTLTLLDGTGTPTGATAVTNADGSYLFDNLRAGDYIVVVDAANFGIAGALQNYRSTTGTEGAPFNAVDHDDGTFSDNGIDETDLTDLTTNGIRSQIIPLALDSEPTGETVLTSGSGNVDGDGDNNLTVDFGFFRPMSLGNVVWFDANNNGLFDATESPIPGVTVELYTASQTPGTDTPIASTITVADGSYLFDDLLEGDYLVHIPASNWTAGATPLAGYLSSTGEELNANTTNVDHPSLTTFNDNGVDSATPQTNGITSRTVTLAFTTEPTGELELTGGRGRATDNNSNLTIDFGFFIPMSLGNVLWYDNNNNGRFEPLLSELPVPAGVQLNLYRDSNTDGVADGPAIQTTATIVGGYYLFDQLGQDNYIVEVDALAFTPGQPLFTYVSSTGVEADINADVDHIDLGNFHDNGIDNATPATNGIRSATVQLILGAEPTIGDDETGSGSGVATDSNSNLTVDFGFFIPMSLGNVVWFDANNNGLFEPAAPNNEVGIDNVTVQLFRAGDNPLVDTPLAVTTTTGGGYYLFDELIPGDYFTFIPTSEFLAGGDLEGYQSSTGVEADINADVDHVDLTNFHDNGIDPVSPATPATAGVASAVITLAYDTEPGAGDNELGSGLGVATDINSNLTVDFGFFIPMSLGNLLWEDTNNSGLIDGGEAPSAAFDGITVELYRDSNTDGTPDTATPLATTTTFGGGYYLFDNLGQDSYIVLIPASEFVFGGSLYGYGSSTPTEVNPNDDADHTAVAGLQENGLNDLQPELNGIRSGTVTLVLGAEPTTDDDTVTATGAATDANSNLTVDFGFFRVLAVGNIVWFDTNNDGLLNGSETGIPNVAVELYNDGDTPGVDTPIDTTTTDAGGFYLFDDLFPGDYIVYIPPSNWASGGPLEGYLSSTPTEINPNDNTDHDATSGVQENGLNDDNAATNGIASGIITLSYGAELTGEPQGPQGNGTAQIETNANLTVDFGFFLPYALGNRVWFDENNDGLLNGTEAGIENVEVTLFRASDTAFSNPLDTTTTSATGYYLFDRLGADDYIVRVNAGNFATGQPLVGMRSSTGEEATPNTNNYDDADLTNFNDNGIDTPSFLTTGIVSAAITLGDGEPTTEPTGGLTPLATDANANLTIDFGFFIPMSLGNVVWFDNNDNGQRDTGELPVAGVELSLFRDSDTNGVPDGPALQTTTTNATGFYLFDLLGADSYVVQVTPANFASGAVLETYRSSTSTEGTPNLDIDQNDNGVNDVAPATNGIFSVPVTLVLNNEPTSEVQGPQGIGSAATDTNSNLTVDFGFVAPMALGNVVWLDNNNNGLRDAGEPGVDGVSLTLFAASDTTFSTPLGTTTTTGGGFYLFDDLTPGNYVVRVDAINFTLGHPLFGYFSSTPTETTPNANVDQNDNGLNPATPGLPVVSGTLTLALETEPTTELLGPQANGNATNRNSNLTVDFGFFPLSGLGDYVWNDTNANGVQDASEPGIAGAIVNLYAAGNLTTPIATTTTNATGFYQFSDLFAGSYVLEFIRPGLDFASSPQNFGSDDAFDSDADPLTGFTAPVTLGFNEYNPTIDAGFYLQTTLPAAIGNFIWYDDNQDGLQDSGETGVPGVEVRLLRADDSIVATTLTDTNGLYLFTGLAPGDYRVVIVPPAGYTISPQDVGSNNAIDSDANPTTGRMALTTLDSGETDLTWDAGIFFIDAIPLRLGDTVWFDANQNGLQDGGSETGVPGVTVQLFNGSGAFLGQTTTNVNGNYLFTNLPSGNYYLRFLPPLGYLISPQDQGGNDAIDSDANPVTGFTATFTLSSDDLTRDAGLFLDPSTSGPIPGSIGTTVWFDANGDGLLNGAELGVPDVEVRLLDENGVLLATAFTDANGEYLFANLAPGNYMVEFIAPPGFVFTIANVGPTDTNDSDADTTSGRTTMISLAPGENSLIWFAGLVNAPTAVGLISFEATANPNQVTLEWVTAAELGTSAYHLFRSTTADFAQATQIAQVPAVGPSTYTYVDTVPAPARYTYWLVEVETSGATTILGSTTATSGPATATSGPAAATYTIYLPLVIR